MNRILRGLPATAIATLVAASVQAQIVNNPPGGSGQYAVWEAAFCGSSETAIGTARSQAAAFNESGDNGTFTPGINADPQGSKALANKPFWDNPANLRGIFTSTPTTVGDEVVETPAPPTAADGE